MLSDNVNNEITGFISSLRKSNDKIIAFSVLRAYALVGVKIVIVGKGASGKDTFLNELLQTYSKDFSKIVWNTTRPIRTGEVEHVDYHFKNEFSSKKLLYRRIFEIGEDIWSYWIDEVDWAYGNTTVGTPHFVDIMSRFVGRHKFIVLYIDEPESVRRTRMDTRKDADSVDRRLDSDARDFHYFNDYDFVLSEGVFRTRNEHLHHLDA